MKSSKVRTISKKHIKKARQFQNEMDCRNEKFFQIMLKQFLDSTKQFEIASCSETSANFDYEMYGILYNFYISSRYGYTRSELNESWAKSSRTSKDIWAQHYLSTLNNKKKLNVILAITRSAYCEKAYHYDGQINLPNCLIDEINLSHVPATGFNAIEVLMYSAKYLLEGQPYVIFSSIKLDDILSYIYIHNCELIHSPQLRVIKLVINDLLVLYKYIKHHLLAYQGKKKLSFCRYGGCNTTITANCFQSHYSKHYKNARKHITKLDTRCMMTGSFRFFEATYDFKYRSPGVLTRRSVAQAYKCFTKFRINAQ